ncbi:MAG TPA: hypothetical protein VH684_23020 [Xanthobacteraceae bacterium]|jgi:hypothetical protein
MTITRYGVLLSALLVVTGLGAGVAAYSQNIGQTWDASQLPVTSGTVRQYTLTPRGDIDGLILNDGTEVKVPPHLTGEMAYAIHPGDAVTIRGLRARALPLVEAASITNSATARTIVDNGPPTPAGGATETTISGRVSATLHGPRGEVNGALLDNGVMLRLPPRETDRMQALFQPGQTIAARGARLDSVLGSVMDVRAIGYSPERLSEVTGGPLPRGKKDGPKRGPDRRGPDAFAPAAPAVIPPPPPPAPRG